MLRSVVEVEVKLLAGRSLPPAVLPDIDTDGDEQITDPERRAGVDAAPEQVVLE